MTIKMHFFLFLAIILTANGCRDEGSPSEKQGGNKYFVSESGNDDSKGTFRSPWKTIEKVNLLNLRPGDAVYFKGGSTFNGTLRLDSSDSGSLKENVLIGSFGEGKAIINGGTGEGLVADRCNHLVIKDLIFNGDGRESGNLTDGVFIASSSNLVVDNCEMSGFQHSGLHVRKAIDVKITHVYAHNNGFAGIHITGATMNDPVNYDNKNLYIGYCIAENNPGDPTVLKGHSGNGILASSVNGGIIEFCEAFNNGWDMPWTGNGPVGIWIWDCTDFIIQYCIAHDNKTNPVAADGGGFDFDGGVSNSVLQYCISFNNQGPGIGLFEFGAAKPWENNVVRYNISQNDGIINGGSLAIWKDEKAGKMKNCEIYNNTFYNDTVNGRALWVYNNWEGFNFRNNIFIYKGPFLDPGQKLVNELFQGNCYRNLSGNPSIAGYKSLRDWAMATGNEMLSDSLIGFFTDPWLIAPGSLFLTDPDMMTPENLSPYALKPGSPLIDRGLDLKKLFMIDPGIHDLVGNSLPYGKGFEVGALEYSSE